MQGWTWPLAALFIAALLGARAQEAAAPADSVSVPAGAPLVVSCALGVGARAEWRLDGRALPHDVTRSERPASGGGGVLAELTASVARPHHAGLYRCGGPRAVRVTVTGPAPPAADLHHAPDDKGKHAPATEASAGTAGAAGAVDWDSVAEFWYNHTLTLTCGDNTPTADVTWTKNGTNINDIPDLKDRALLSNGQTLLTIRRAKEEDYGNWTCSQSGSTRAWRVRSVLHAKLHPETSVVEGQRLKLTCKIVGRPYVPVDWFYLNDTESNVTYPVQDVLGARVVLNPSDQQIENAELVVEAAERSDAGVYMCVPRGPVANFTIPSRTNLRVKDMYAALWPFLGIVAEVVILCAVILVYERRRAQPTMDDSDTDHDTKKS